MASARISSSGDQTIRVCGLVHAQTARGFCAGTSDEVDGVALASDGQALASRCKDGSIFCGTRPNRRAIPNYRTLPKPRWTDPSIAFTPDGHFIVSD